MIEAGSTPTVAEVRTIAALDDPVIRNLQITQAYHALSSAMARLTGPGANWCTVATWASKQAGQSIRREDLTAAFRRLLRDLADVQDNAAMLLSSTGKGTGDELESIGGAIEALWQAISPAAAFDRTSDAVARGNRKVFDEIGAEFARFLALWSAGTPSDAVLQAFLDGLRPGEPPDGQRFLRQAFTHYTEAVRMQDARLKAELLLLANLEIGFHEQTRLQPEIVEAMNAPVVNPAMLRRRLVAELFPDAGSRIRYWLGRFARRMDPFIQARDRLAEQAQQVGRQVVTAALMTLTLPPGRVLRLGQPLPDPLPNLLADSAQSELVTLLDSVDPTPDADAAVQDWGDLRQRMGYIAKLFRTYHLTPALFDPPFSDAQASQIKVGRRPTGPL